jgi:hypothetical protein
MSYDVPIPRPRSPAKYIKIILNRRDPRKEKYLHLRVFVLYIILYCQTDDGWLPDDSERFLLEIERGSTRSHFVENWLWKGLCICRKTDYSSHS